MMENDEQFYFDLIFLTVLGKIRFIIVFTIRLLLKE